MADKGAMTPTAEPSFMMTLIPIFLSGVVSSVLTLLLGQPLQHYFWRRQRYAERQFAVIDGVNRWVAEVEYYLATRQFSPEAQEDLHKTLIMLSGNVRTLFSLRAVERCQTLYSLMIDQLRATEREPEHRKQIRQQFQEAHRNALTVLYQDMGIPPRRPWPNMATTDSVG